MGQLIVLFEDNTTTSEMRSTLEIEGLTVVKVMKETFEKMNISTDSIPATCLVNFSGGSEQDWVSKLTKLPKVVSVESNLPVKF